MNQNKAGDTTATVLASVIMPCYNCASYIRETIDCLEAQLCRDFEVICINDGSTDQTLQILMQWEKRSNLKIRVIDQPNAGVSATRNRGIQLAEGKYILFLDSDDIYHQGFVGMMLKRMEEGQADTVYCKLSRDLDRVRNLSVASVSVQEVDTHEAMSDLMYRMGEIGFYCYVYVKDILIREGLEFDIHTKHGEDREFNWKYLCKCRSIVKIDAPLYGYRVNAQSATRRKIDWERVEKGLAWVKRVEAYLEQNECSFLPQLKSYLYARVMWAYAKGLALDANKELFDKLVTTYDVTTCMRQTAKAKCVPVAVSSMLFLVSKSLFYKAITLYGLLKSK